MAYNIEAMKKDGLTESQISEVIGFDYGSMVKDKLSIEQINQIIDTNSAGENKEVQQTPLINAEENPNLLMESFGESNNTPTMQSEEEGQTIPTSLVQGMDSQYASEKAIQNEILKRQQQSSINQTPYIDPITGQQKRMVQEAGLEDSSLDAIVGGKLGLISGNPLKQVSAYDDVVKGLYEIGKNSSLSSRIANKYPSDVLTKDAKVVADRIGITQDQALEIITNVKPEFQALEIAKLGGAKGVGFMSGAIKASPEASAKYLSEISDRTRAIKDIVGDVDFEKTARATRKEFQLMQNTVDDFSSATYNAEEFLPKLEELKKVGSNSDMADRRIQAIIDNINEEPVKSVGDMVRLRADINHELSKAKGGQAVKWKEFKNSLDGFMKENLDDDVLKLVEQSTASYKRMKQQEELIDIVGKNTKSLGEDTVGGASATNWSSLLKDIKEAGLDSIETKNAINLARKFSNKFGDMDVKMFGQSLPKGIRDNVETFTSEPSRALQVMANRSGVSWLVRQFSGDAKAQKAISDAMAKSNTKAEFYADVIKSKNTPERVRKEIISLLRDVDLSAKNIAKKKGVSIKKQREARKVQLDMNKKDLKLQKKDKDIIRLQDKIDELIMKNDEKPSASLERTIERLEQDMGIAEKELSLLEQDYNKAKGSYDNLQVEIEDLELFSPPREATSSPEVTSK